MTLRFHEIAEGDHRILNPFTDEKLALVGEICALDGDTRQLGPVLWQGGDVGCVVAAVGHRRRRRGHQRGVY